MKRPAAKIPASAASQVHLNPTLTKDSAVGALAAYADFDRKPVVLPKGYTFKGRFTGWDGVFHEIGEEERFGLVLQSSAEPSTYMVAFRGTDSTLDGYEDLWATTVPFVPYKNDGRFPKNAEVASGFDGIYRQIGDKMTRSLQGQVFDLLDQQVPSPKTVLICGHSLGSSLANLFALDATVSRPDWHVVSTTFASPRTGKSVWKKAYNSQYKLLDSTFRIANHWDIVPYLPPHTVLDYEHIGQQFLVSFYVQGAIIPHYLSRHSMLNYQTVIDQAVVADPQVWVGTFPDAKNLRWTMQSTAPPAVQGPEWSHLLGSHELAKGSTAG